MGEVVGVNTAYAMIALGGRGIAEDKSLFERSSDGGWRASATEPELPGEVTGGFEVIENNRGGGGVGSSKVFNPGERTYVT